ncbi:hypothetical protein GCM10009687_36290 [Asanoa iriomotensis]|uniref:DUF3558 domain-containing protein n=2 Tax=Asanoa iriomotensis TaxID=234613 RepID=A0ABQ4CB14_9ACTN|nr:hypothetical protein Air01nite_60660 [Asanoa iriomotensis]
MSCVLLALAGCTSARREQAPPPPDLASLASPCGFLRDAERDDLGLGPGALTTAPGLEGGAETTQCVYREAEPGAGRDAYVDSVSVTFLPTTLDLARRALETVENRGLFTAGRMSAFAAAPDGVLQREGTRLGEPTCERLFAVRPDRAVQVGYTVERLPLGEPVCQAAARLAPLVDTRIPR